MRTMLLLAGPRIEMNPANGGNVLGRDYDQFDPLSICKEYAGNVKGSDIPSSLPSVGAALLPLFKTTQELDEAFAARLLSVVEAALNEDATLDNSDVAASRKYATHVTVKDLQDWINTHQGRWIAQAWLG